MLEPASRLLYTEEDGETLFWANGEGICISEAFTAKLKQIADGERVLLDEVSLTKICWRMLLSY
jgi:hypothetical protein